MHADGNKSMPFFSLRSYLRLSAFICGLIVLVAHGFAAEPQFTISYWCGPPADFVSLERFQEIKDAGFTVAFPPCGGMTVEDNRKVLDYCQQVGLKVFVQDRRLPMAIGNDAKTKAAIDAAVKDYSSYPALAGYFITDEPNAGAFPGLAQVIAYLKEKDPAHPSYVNLLPTYARDFSMLSTNYEDYLNAAMRSVKPFVLSYDHYNLTAHGDREDFFENLYTVRNVAQQFNVPFWNIVLAVQHFAYRDLNEAELRFEAMQTLAFGAHGLLWFTYWSPADPNDKTPPEKRQVIWQHAMINPDGSKDRHYDLVKKINADVMAIGNELIACQSIEVYQPGKPVTTRPSIAEKSPPGKPTDGCPIKILGDANLTVGVFLAPDGKHLALIANRDYKSSSSARAAISPADAPAEQFELATKTWSPAPAHERGVVEVALPPGGADLIRW